MKYLKLFEDFFIPKFTSKDSLEYKAKLKTPIDMGDIKININDKISFTKNQSLFDKIFNRSSIFGEKDVKFKKGEVYTLKNFWSDEKLNYFSFQTFSEDIALLFISDGNKELVLSKSDLYNFYKKGIIKIN